MPPGRLSRLVAVVACDRCPVLLVAIDTCGHGSGLLLADYVAVLDGAMARVARDMRGSDVCLVAECYIVRHAIDTLPRNRLLLLIEFGELDDRRPVLRNRGMTCHAFRQGRETRSLPAVRRRVTVLASKPARNMRLVTERQRLDWSLWGIGGGLGCGEQDNDARERDFGDHRCKRKSHTTSGESAPHCDRWIGSSFCRTLPYRGRIRSGSAPPRSGRRPHRRRRVPRRQVAPAEPRARRERATSTHRCRAGCCHP